VTNLPKEQQAGCCTVSFKVCRINFELTLNTFGPGKPNKYTVKQAPSAPSHKAIIKCFVGTVFRRCTPPLQSMLQDMNDPRYNSKIINTRHTGRQRKMGRNALLLLRA